MATGRNTAISLLASSLIIVGCGGEGRVVAWSAKSAPVRFCQLRGGSWVTNDPKHLPCTPDPAWATGDPQADGTRIIPRCVSCTPGQWARAERRAARVVQVAGGEAPATDTSSTRGWSPNARAEFLRECPTITNGSSTGCQCLADILAREVPESEIPSLSAADERMHDAQSGCRETRGPQSPSTGVNQ